MAVERLLLKQINMSAITCSVLFFVALLAMAVAYVPVRPMSMSSSSSWCGPRYDTSCRESIADLKALLDITQSLRHENNNYTCETCARTFNEEVILKLINALVITATHNCGLAAHLQPYGSNNIGVWNAGGGYMGGNTIVVGGPVGAPGAVAAGATNTSEDGLIDEALIKLGILDGQNTVGLGIGDTDVLEANVADIVGRRAANNLSQKDRINKDDGLVKGGVVDGKNIVGPGVGRSDVVPDMVRNIVAGDNSTKNNNVAPGVNNVAEMVKSASDKVPLVPPVPGTPALALEDSAAAAANS